MTDTSNVISFDSKASQPGRPAAPDHEVVAMLEETLASAKTGRLTGFTLIGLDADRGAFHVHGGFVGTFEMIGALEAAKHFLLSLEAEA